MGDNKDPGLDVIPARASKLEVKTSPTFLLTAMLKRSNISCSVEKVQKHTVAVETQHHIAQSAVEYNGEDG